MNYREVKLSYFIGFLGNRLDTQGLKNRANVIRENIIINDLAFDYIIYKLLNWYCYVRKMNFEMVSAWKKKKKKGNSPKFVITGSNKRN